MRPAGLYKIYCLPQMRVLVLGYPPQQEDFKSKFTASHTYHFQDHYQFSENLEDFDVVFDFMVGDDPDEFQHYAGAEGLTVFVNAPKLSLAELAYYQDELSCALFGFNGLPTFLGRDVLEVSCLREEDQGQLDAICKALETDYELVGDRVGMVTPRIVCMIINEAFYTLQEGTASVEDIDKGMKLGTNYPYGPFEWCQLIGLNNVYELLEAIYDDTKEERYKICPLLKTSYLKL